MEEERTPGDDQPISLREARMLALGIHQRLDKISRVIARTAFMALQTKAPEVQLSVDTFATAMRELADIAPKMEL